MEDEFEPPRARLIGADQRLVGAAVRIGRDIGDELALGAASQLVKLDADAIGRPADGDIEDMGGEAGQIVLPRRYNRPPSGRARRF